MAAWRWCESKKNRMQGTCPVFLTMLYAKGQWRMERQQSVDMNTVRAGMEHLLACVSPRALLEQQCCRRNSNSNYCSNSLVKKLFSSFFLHYFVASRDANAKSYVYVMALNNLNRCGWCMRLLYNKQGANFL